MTYRVLAHIENSEGIYIAAECPLEHSAKSVFFYALFNSEKRFEVARQNRFVLLVCKV